MITPACVGCEYSEALQTSERLRCRRYAPRPGETEAKDTQWPLVLPEDWCGEFLERNSMDEPIA